MWKTVKLGDVCILNYGKALDRKDRLENAAIPVYGANGIKTYSNKLLHDKPSIIIGRKGSAGELNLPSLSEQESIVTKLDAAFAEIDKAIKLTAEKEAALKSLKQSILSSKLMPEDT